MHLILLAEPPESSKFWEIEVKKNTCEIQSGTAYPNKVKKQVRMFKTETEALEAAKKLVDQKRKQGYIDQPPGSREIEMMSQF